MEYKEIDGDLIHLAKQGTFDVIAHGCNCFNTMKRGIAPQMAKAFDCDKFIMEAAKQYGNINKLGCIDYRLFYYSEPPMRAVTATFIVVNAYTQYDWRGEKPLDYDALRLCLRKINHTFKGKHIGLPRIGCGLAGGIWSSADISLTELSKQPRFLGFVKDIIKQELKDCNVTVVNYKP